MLNQCHISVSPTVGGAPILFVSAKHGIRHAINWLRIKRRLWPQRRKLLSGPARFMKIHSGSLDVRWLAQRLEEVRWIFEIGSNSGEDTLKALETFPRARVVCFEPDPRAAARWKENVTSARAELHQCAISHSDGEVEFFQSEGAIPGGSPATLNNQWDLSGSIRKPTGHKALHPWVTFMEPIRVNSFALDTVSAALGILNAPDPEISLIWVDVQGAEVDVIEGARETLKKTRYLYTEYSNDQLYEGQVSLNELCKRLPDFRISRLWKNDVLFENKNLVLNLERGVSLSRGQHRP